ncbi:Scn11a [Symbiodinium sp. CCMP2456]|nr:Scn11a [Symbiodinium sp. CCMP2456]
MAEVKEGRVRSVTLGEMPASFEQLLEELRHTHQMELAEVKAEADRLLVEKKTWTAITERSRAREVEDDEESDTTLPDPNLFSSEKVVPLETFLEGEEFPPSPSEGETDIADSMTVSAPFENKIDIQEEIENAKPWMDEEGNKHYKNDNKPKGESLQDAGLSLDSPDPLPRDASLLAHALESDRYELLVGATVLASVGIMAADYQYAGYSVGQAIEFQGMHELPWGDPNPEWIAVVSMCLDIIFGVDVLVRVAVLRCRFFRLFVNWIDLFVAILSVSASFIAGLDEGFNVWALRMLRLAKVARALRLMRMRRALESLSLLLRCVQSSLQVLFWSLGLLGVIQCIAGMVIGQLLMPYMRNESIDVVRRAEVYKYFGTFNRTLLTMFEVLFANWAIPARICIENVSEGFIYIFIFYRCLVGFAVLNVATGPRNRTSLEARLQIKSFDYGGIGTIGLLIA